MITFMILEDWGEYYGVFREYDLRNVSYVMLIEKEHVNLHIQHESGTLFKKLHK